MEMNNLNSFLKLGYFINFENQKYEFDFSRVDKLSYAGYSEEDLIKEGGNKLLSAMEKNFKKNSIHVVPISGGLDSRVILASILEFTESKNVYTYTFGIPNSLDFEIGNKVAQYYSTNHTGFRLDEYEFNQNELLDVSDRVNHQTVLFHNAPIYRLDEQYKGANIWSGFMGDPLAGSHLNLNSTNDLSREKQAYIENNTFVKNIDLTCVKDSEYYKYIKISNIALEQLTLKEQIDFENRQLKYVAPHVLMDGYDYVTPFLDDDWQMFILSIDNKYRYDQKLYNQILLDKFPKAFSIETKNNYGYGLDVDLSRFHKASIRLKDKLAREMNYRFNIFNNKSLNYINFPYAIRNDKVLNKIIFDNIMDLKSRKIVDWIDIDHIWKTNLDKSKNLTNALLVLASLEIHLKAKER